MQISELAEFLENLEKTSSRIEMTKILAELFKKASREEIEDVVNLILGQLAPNYEGIVFNIAERMMLQAVTKAYGVGVDSVRKAYKQKGDMGDVAFVLAQSKKSKTKKLSVRDVYNRLKTIAEDEGEGSQDRKITEVAKLLSELDGLSAKYVARIPIGKLRLGFSDKTIIDALSWMEEGDKSKSSKLTHSYEVVPNIGKLAKLVKEKGIENVSDNVKPEIGVPVLPMLAQRVKSPEEMIKKMGKVCVEPKFDGLRVLIHYKKLKGGDLIRAFTRNLNNVYEMFPELDSIAKHISAKSVILDSEAVGLSPDEKRIADFQTTMKRRRKHDIAETAKNIPLRFQVFDIMFKDGINLMGEAYSKRREILEKTIKDSNLLVVDEVVETNDPNVINDEYRKKIAEGLEGIIVKKVDAKYIPGRTGYRWVKMKMEATSSAKLADTVDCIVMAYYVGRGKRASFGIGGFLVGIPNDEEIMTLTKIGTGLTDEQFRELHTRLKKLKTNKKPKEYGEVNRTLEPDVWVTPSLVVEIAADEITKSPIHSSGYALRFPRLVKFRDDKKPADATSLTEIKKIFKLQ
ncbi:MAG: putative DNA ligase [Candidatus Woesebacteria bacterium GW2011_GWA1_39_8]|jgi:DNA ligase-1|uniref:DNA ligase (ATP) n=1 Tax=Candidatus Woesebacteria bacterium GW2011_GWA1_39_8 TaxID=1618552 RepID=A0A0G0PVW6_9BACT|nr:MAG: putative DNA ligase [Candidatus Woesebacteria bacterium GW2011_GWA1_39_8]